MFIGATNRLRSYPSNRDHQFKIVKSIQLCSRLTYLTSTYTVAVYQRCESLIETCIQQKFDGILSLEKRNKRTLCCIRYSDNLIKNQTFVQSILQYLFTKNSIVYTK